MNLTFPSYNLGSIQNGPNKSFIKYKLSPYNLQEFFEIRFRFLPNPLDQNNSLLMFMSQFSSSSPSSSSSMMMDHGNNLLSLIYQNKFLILSLNLGQGRDLFAIRIIFSLFILLLQFPTNSKANHR